VILDGSVVTEPVPEDPIPPLWDADEQVRNWHSRPTNEDVAAAAEALAGADRPVVIAGNGVHASQAYDELQAVAEAYGCAVTTSYLGKSTIPETHDLAAGVIGAFGHEGANRVVSEADALLVVGSRLNPMDTNWSAPDFVRPDEQTIVHADVDPRNAGWVYPADVGLIGDAAESLRALVDAVDAVDGTGGPSDRSLDWARDRAAEARESFTAPECESDAVPIKPQRAVAEIEAIVDAETIVTADSGNNRFWLLQYLQTPAVRTYFGSGGVAGMGWATPAAVSASLATDDDVDVIAVAGDGGFAMTMTSVETAVEQGVAPTIVVLNDASLGMVRQMADASGDIAGVEFHDTDFVAVARAFGADGVRVDAPDDLADALREGKRAETPFVVDVRIDREEAMADRLASSFYESVGGLHE
jgi:acetolactate synthase-1/2/3 large subunit